jgi:hypothetical protein
MAISDLNLSIPSEPRKALLLGAGFSKIAGMPLVWDLTNDLYALITRADWRRDSKQKNNPIIPIIYELIKKLDLHYEDFISSLDVAQGRFENRAHLQDISGVKLKVIELVYHILFTKQVAGFQAFKNDRFISGFKKFVQQCSPLWVFSLNHDNFVEFLCLENRIPIRNGFKAPAQSFTINNVKIPFDCITAEKVHNAESDFFRLGESGLNLMKLHGGLEQFGVHDMKDYISLSIRNSWTEFNKHLSVINRIPPKDMIVTNEIIGLDEVNEMQFLRRLHLAGSYKFDKRYPKNTPDCWVNRFSGDINIAEELTVVGYGFGDYHINATIEKWIVHNSQRKMIVVAPKIKAIPNGFAQFCFQIELKEMSAEEYFGQFA